jgi:hypothetical protein
MLRHMYASNCVHVPITSLGKSPIFVQIFARFYKAVVKIILPTHQRGS